MWGERRNGKEEERRNLWKLVAMVSQILRLASLTFVFYFSFSLCVEPWSSGLETIQSSQNSGRRD